MRGHSSKVHRSSNTTRHDTTNINSSGQTWFEHEQRVKRFVFITRSGLLHSLKRSLIINQNFFFVYKILCHLENFWGTFKFFEMENLLFFFNKPRPLLKKNKNTFDKQFTSQLENGKSLLAHHPYFHLNDFIVNFYFRKKYMEYFLNIYNSRHWVHLWDAVSNRRKNIRRKLNMKYFNKHHSFHGKHLERKKVKSENWQSIWWGVKTKQYKNMISGNVSITKPWPIKIFFLLFISIEYFTY